MGKGFIHGEGSILTWHTTLVSCLLNWGKTFGFKLRQHQPRWEIRIVCWAHWLLGSRGFFPFPSYIGVILASLKDDGTHSRRRIALKICVIQVLSRLPPNFRCSLETPSGPVALRLGSFEIAFETSSTSNYIYIEHIILMGTRSSGFPTHVQALLYQWLYGRRSEVSCIMKRSCVLKTVRMTFF